MPWNQRKGEGSDKKIKKSCKTKVEEFEEVTTGQQRTVVTQLLNHKVPPKNKKNKKTQKNQGTRFILLR